MHSASCFATIGLSVIDVNVDDDIEGCMTYKVYILCVYMYGCVCICRCVDVCVLKWLRITHMSKQVNYRYSNDRL